MKNNFWARNIRGCFSAALIFSFDCIVTAQVAQPPIAETPRSNISFTVEPAQDYNRLFYQESDWVGGDVAASVPLRDGNVLWLFGDSWIGSICEGRRSGESKMVHNTIAIQEGLNPETARVNFFHGLHGYLPAAFIETADHVGYFWLTHGGIQTDDGLYLFASRIINRPGDNSVWGFKASGMTMAKITNVSAQPSEWRIEQIKIPWAEYDKGGSEKVFGMPMVRADGFIYIYGLEFDRKAHNRYLLVGRVKEGSLENFSAWEFYADGKWQSDFHQASRLADHLGAELSVSYLPRFKRYVLVYTENGLSEKIMLRSAVSPVGPWSEPTVIYRTPETGWDKTYFCYAAKAHPELSRADDELIVSYVCNSSDFGKMVNDARIYFPKFVRVKFDAIP
ncbi:MAG TPA: DUF5005 domain-containing protein [Verrucomicrobiae bacterium]|nr:DUF5005 domain-containing protein [Verrucomicrobiae bacterium]